VYKRQTISDQTLIDNIFNALDISDSITALDIPAKIKYCGSIILNNDKLPNLTFDLELILFKDTDVYYLGIYNQNKLAPIPEELAKELREYLK
jgi:hypothetical protein